MSLKRVQHSSTAGGGARGSPLQLRGYWQLLAAVGTAAGRLSVLTGNTEKTRERGEEEEDMKVGGGCWEVQGKKGESCAKL